jgi:hypothetical protein
MPDAVFPYETRLNILHPPLEIIDILRFSETIEFKWFNQTLSKVNDSVVRIGVIEGEYHWHKHDQDDEFFYVVSEACIAQKSLRIFERCRLTT